MKVYDHPDQEKAKVAFEAAIGGKSRDASGAGLGNARDLLASLDRKDIIAIFQELLLDERNAEAV